MNGSARKLTEVTGLRDAALTLLEMQGERESDRVWFGRHTPENLEPRLTAVLSHYPRYSSLEVWSTLRGKHAKVLNMAWKGDAVQVTSFRRGDWESELLAMGRAQGFAVH